MVALVEGELRTLRPADVFTRLPIVNLVLEDRVDVGVEVGRAAGVGGGKGAVDGGWVINLCT